MQEEKKALRDAIAALEAKLPAARGTLNAAEAEKKDAGENGYMLLAANFERYRQQAQSEMAMQKGFGQQNTLRKLLPFIETFEHLQGSAAEGDDDGTAIHSYYGGIYRQTLKLLEDWQVSPFEAQTGDRFDYKIHESVETVASEEVPDGIIVQACERGWKIGDETLRQAKVIVSTGPAVSEEVEQAVSAGSDDAIADNGTVDASEADGEA